MNCPVCTTAMVKAKATNFGEEYDYCRPCGKELKELRLELQTPQLAYPPSPENRINEFEVSDVVVCKRTGDCFIVIAVDRQTERLHLTKYLGNQAHATLVVPHTDYYTPEESINYLTGSVVSLNGIRPANVAAYAGSGGSGGTGHLQALYPPVPTPVAPSANQAPVISGLFNTYGFKVGDKVKWTLLYKIIAERDDAFEVECVDPGFLGIKTWQTKAAFKHAVKVP